MSDVKTISVRDRLRIALECNRSARTVARVLAGGGSEYSRAAVAQACERLGLPPLPPARGQQ